MLYHYIDETSRQHCGSWYASIGGALIEPEVVLNVEFDLLTTLKKFSTLTPVEIQSEFKFSEFFRGQADELKIEILESLCETLSKIDITFLIGQAKCETRKMDNLIDIHGTAERAIQWLAFHNVANNLAPFTASGQVQTIVDLGVSKSFTGLYNMYMGKWRGLLAVKQMEIDENQITIPNFRNLLPPLFIAIPRLQSHANI